VRSIHTGVAAESASAEPWASAITATTRDRVFVRGLPLDEAIGSFTFADIVFRLWTGREGTSAERSLLDACLVAAVDHGALAPSVIAARTVATTRAGRMPALAAGILAFGSLHGAVVTTAMELLAELGPEEDPESWAARVFDRERAAGRRIPGIGHRWHQRDRRAERLLHLAGTVGGGRSTAAEKAISDVVSRHSGRPAPVNIDGGIAAALTSLGLGPEFGDFVFAISRSAGLAAHIVEETTRQRPMRTIDPTRVAYDGPEFASKED
jgi:citrate synthase/citryl-CoA lyase